MANIQDTINQAKEAAAAMVQTEEPSTAVIEGYVQPSGQIINYSRPTMASMAASTGVIPKATPYLKVNEDGIKIGKDKTYLTGFQGRILMVEEKGFQGKWTIRYGNPAQYLSSYDGAGCDKGGTWSDAVGRARRADLKAEPYPSVDVVITLTEALKLKDETLPVGSRVGFNSSKTNFSEWGDFYALCAEKGLLGQFVDVTIGFKEITHGGNTWGVLTFSNPLPVAASAAA